MKKDMDNCLMETLQLSDYNELMARCDSLRVHSQKHGQIEVASDLKDTIKTTTTMDGKQGYSLITVDEPSTATIDKNGSIELLTRYFQRGIHSQLDLFTEMNLSTYDSLFTHSLALRGIVYLPHRIEIVNLRQDSTIVKAISNPPTYFPSKEAECFYYNYDLYNKMAYRLWVEPTHRVVLHQMQGILGTSFIIILILGISFWYLLRIILQQKTVEELKEDFTHNITHELKTPIAVAYAANDALLNFPSDTPEKRKDYHLIVQEQLKHLGGLVEQILSMSRKQNKNFRLSYEMIELRPMIENIIHRQQLKSNCHADIRLNMEEDILIRADRTHLSNMISNLSDNAEKYSEGKAEIYIKCQATETTCQIIVTDKGIGIPLDKQPYLFNKFYRVPTGNRHDVKGYGLGLYYVKTMAELHGGSIHVESSPGKGSTFTLEIPL
jgi:signal transduction histidine kinase